MFTNKFILATLRNQFQYAVKPSLIKRSLWIVVKPKLKNAPSFPTNKTVLIKPLFFPRCAIYTTPKLRNPIVSTIGRQVIKIFTIFVARSIRNRFKKLPDDKKRQVIAWLIKHKWKFIASSFLIVFSLFYYYLSHIQETPITKRRRFIAFTPEQFEFINRTELKFILENFAQKLLPTEHPTTVRVAKVAKQIVSQNKDIERIKDYEWTVSVIDEPNTTNAFVLPSGNIFVFTGLLKICENDDQLGIVLSHEISHAILLHGIELTSHAHIVDMIFIGVIGFIFMLFPTDLIAAIGSAISRFVMKIILETPYSKMLENEADEVGLFLAAKACFDVREASAFWDKMSLVEKIGHKELFGEKPMNLDFLNTHPSHEERSLKLEKLIVDAIKCRSDNQCPPLPKNDPRDRLKSITIDLMNNESSKKKFGVLKIENV